MWLERGTLWDSLKLALLAIRDDAVMRANNANRLMRYRRWKYDELAGLWGEPEDWRYDGKARRLITGHAARERLMEEFGLVWKADEADHDGLLFTACPLTGTEWERDRIAARTVRDGAHLVFVCRWAAKMRPAFRAEFRRIEKYGKKLLAAGSKLIELGNLSLLSLMGGNGIAGGNSKRRKVRKPDVSDDEDLTA